MELTNTRSVTIYALPGEAHSLQTLNSIGVPAKQCTYRENAGETFDCFPWVSVERIEALGPYVAQADWGHVWGGTSGVMRSTTLVSLFGLVFSVSERDTIAL